MPQVKKLNDCIGEEVEKAVKDAKEGEVGQQAEAAMAVQLMGQQRQQQLKPCALYLLPPTAAALGLSFLGRLAAAAQHSSHPWWHDMYHARVCARL